jgi:CTP:molybdopterin cytidylyltransferase MocA
MAGASGLPAMKGQNKCYWPIRGRPVVQRLLDVLREREIPRLFLLTEAERTTMLDLPPGTEVLASSRRQSQNLVKAREALREATPDGHALVLFGDTPLLCHECLDDFLARCARDPADLIHGLVPYAFTEPFMRFYPHRGTRRRPFATREFWARLGALTLVRPTRVDTLYAVPRIERFMGARKQDPGESYLAHAMARARMLVAMFRFLGVRGLWIGAVAALAYSFRFHGFPHGAETLRELVTLADYGRETGRILRCQARYIPCPFGGASLDVDTEDDLNSFEEHWDEMERVARVGHDLIPLLSEPERDPFAEASADARVEMEMYPEAFREQRRICLDFPLDRG